MFEFQQNIKEEAEEKARKKPNSAAFSNFYMCGFTTDNKAHVSSECKASQNKTKRKKRQTNLFIKVLNKQEEE